jgi:protease-4
MDNRFDGSNFEPNLPPPQSPQPPHQIPPPPQHQPPPQPQYHQPPPQFVQAAPKSKFRSAMKTTAAAIAVMRGLFSLLLIFMFVLFIGALFAGTAPVSSSGPPSDSFSVISINGVIVGERSFAETGYDHRATVKYIKELADNPRDKGILLYMDTPGGTVFHSDELYLALMGYKEKTGRPVYAYMSELCASGGFYISMAADYIFANRITMTGSLGVVSTMFDTSELFDNIGIRTVIIDTGEHKAAGSLGTVITPRQEAVLREMADEFYGLFVELIAAGRKMDEQTVRGLADGRIYTAGQALRHGLIDEISGWDTVLEEFQSKTGVKAYFPDLSTETTFMAQLLARVPNASTGGIHDFPLMGAGSLPKGVPLVVAQEFLN